MNLELACLRLTLATVSDADLMILTLEPIAIAANIDLMYGLFTFGTSYINKKHMIGHLLGYHMPGLCICTMSGEHMHV